MLRSLCAAVASLITAVCVAQGQSADARARPESQQEYWAQIDRKDWSAAVAAAEKLVEGARTQADQQPMALVEALTMLGNAQYGAANYTAAETSFTEALKLVEAQVGAASPKLLDPLRGLGYTLAASGRHNESIPVLERALLIDRRSYGLYDIGQQKMLRQLAESLVKVGRPTDAERHVAYLAQLGDRVYGKRDPRKVPILCYAASWYAEIGDFITARAIYRTAIDLVNQKLGPNDPAAVQPLRELADTYMRELYFSSLGLRTQAMERQPTDANGSYNDTRQMNPRSLAGEGEDALEHAVKILEAQPPSAHDTLADTLIQLGDWFQVKTLPDRALPYYRRAATLTASLATPAATPAPAAATAAPAESEPPRPLSFPVRVYYPTPIQATRYAKLPAEQVDERFVEVAFTVTAAGEVSGAKVTEANGTQRQIADALSAIRAARYRPRFVNGEPVETTGLTNREVFRTRKEGVDGGR